MWKALWAIKAPGKMLITLWRFAHDCLPSGRQLQKRHIPASPLCIHCSKEEPIEHALLFCPYARAVWSGIKQFYDIQLNRRGFNSPKTWIFDFLARGGAVQATVLAVTCWHIWDARNKLREENVMISPVGLSAKIKAYVDMILEYLYVPKPNHRR